MIGLKLSEAKATFFDRPRVQSAVDRATRRVLSRFGAFVRTRARSSIRRRKGTSRPGSPPYSHGPYRGRAADIKMIFFGYDPARRSVVIGPVRLNQALGDALPALEYGGPSRITVWRGRRHGGHKLLRTVTIRPRPFMHPALEAEKPKLPAMWAGSVR